MKETNQKQKDQPPFDSKLLPILVEGVQMVKLITFKELQGMLRERYPQHDGKIVNLLAGTLINEIFQTPNTAGIMLQFRQQHHSLIEAEIALLGTSLQQLKPLLTDAVRIQFLIDSQEGTDKPAILEQAKSLGILDLEREVPMPARFIYLVRRVGQAHGLLAPEPPKGAGTA